METKRHPVNLKQYRKVNGKWQFVHVVRNAQGNPDPRLILLNGHSVRFFSAPGFVRRKWRLWAGRTFTGRKASLPSLPSRTLASRPKAKKTALSLSPWG